jgi:hypothetical protein
MRSPLAVALASLLLAACGSPSGDVASAPTATPSDGAIPWSSRLASPTPRPAPTPALASCRPEDINVSFEGWGAAAGSSVGSFRLSPMTPPDCGFAANPAYRFVTKYADRVLAHAAISSSVPTVPLVAPAGKSSTFVLLQWGNHGGEPGWVCRSRSLPLHAIEVQSGAQWVQLSFAAAPISLCLDPAERVFIQVTAPESLLPPLPEPVFDTKIVAPLKATAGEHMRYVVQLTNRTTVSQRFGECPAYVQNIAGPQELGSSDRPGFRFVERRQILNCAGTGEIAPGATLAFEMYFDIPEDVLPGTYVLPWRLDGPVYSIGYKVSLGIER